VLGIVYRAISTHLIHKAGLQMKDGAIGAVTLIQRLGSALNLNIHFHILFLVASSFPVRPAFARRALMTVRLICITGRLSRANYHESSGVVLSVFSPGSFWWAPIPASPKTDFKHFGCGTLPPLNMENRRP
jgi:Putative transposase